MRLFRTSLSASVLWLSGAVFAAPTTWEIDPAHSTALFTVRHMMITDVRGEFGKLTGTVNWDDKDVSKSTVEATIDAATINTRNDKRNAHLKSADFFDVEKFPTIVFKSTKVHLGAQKGKFEVTGDLTIHGVTKPVTLHVTGPSPEMKDPQGNVKVGAKATTKINRKDFGLKWNVPLEGGGVLVGDDVAIEIDLEMGKKLAAGKTTAGTTK